MSNDAQDSGLIDLFAAHRAGQASLRAQEERGSNLPSSPPPAVALDAAPFAPLVSGRARVKWIAGGIGALALLGVIIGFAASGGESASVAAAAAASPPPVTVMAPAPAEVVAPAPAVAPAVALKGAPAATTPEPEPVASKPTSTKRRGGGRGKGSGSGGVKLMKVSSGGVETATSRSHK